MAELPPWLEIPDDGAERLLLWQRRAASQLGLGLFLVAWLLFVFPFGWVVEHKIVFLSITMSVFLAVIGFSIYRGFVPRYVDGSQLQIDTSRLRYVRRGMWNPSSLDVELRAVRGVFIRLDPRLVRRRWGWYTETMYAVSVQLEPAGTEVRVIDGLPNLRAAAYVWQRIAQRCGVGSWASSLAPSPSSSSPTSIAPLPALAVPTPVHPSPHDPVPPARVLVPGNRVWNYQAQRVGGIAIAVVMGILYIGCTVVYLLAPP